MQPHSTVAESGQQGPELVRTPRTQPACPSAVHIAAPTPQEQRPASKLGQAPGGSAMGGAMGGGPVAHTALKGPAPMPAAQSSQKGGDVRGAWADAGSQPERPPSQAGTLPAAAPAPAAAEEQQPGAPAGLGISFKIGLGGAPSGGIKSKASAPAPTLFGADDHDEDDE